MLNNKVNHLFTEQLNEWELAKKSYNALKQVKTKTLVADNREYKIQFNPARLVSSTAKVDAQSVRERKCFLCKENRPSEQKEILFDGRYTILLNPYPIFPRHFTIPAVEHTPQLIATHFVDMLDLAQQLDDYIVFYNGPKCGASAPDHFHFQAGNKGFLPCENYRDWRNTLRIESDNKQEMFQGFQQIYNAMENKQEDGEPMMNILSWYENAKWVVCIFPRKKHRPLCYYAEGETNLLISPAAVDLGGVFITPLEKDFEKITAEDIIQILNEV